MRTAVPRGVHDRASAGSVDEPSGAGGGAPGGRPGLRAGVGGGGGRVGHGRGSVRCDPRAGIGLVGGAGTAPRWRPAPEHGQVFNCPAGIQCGRACGVRAGAGGGVGALLGPVCGPGRRAGTDAWGGVAVSTTADELGLGWVPAPAAGSAARRTWPRTARLAWWLLRRPVIPLALIALVAVGLLSTPVVAVVVVVAAS